MEYPKIETIFNRDDKFKVIEDAYRFPELELIDNWWITEKIDGTNVRIFWRRAESYESKNAMVVRFGGRTSGLQPSKRYTSLLFLQYTWLESLLDLEVTKHSTIIPISRTPVYTTLGK